MGFYWSYTLLLKPPVFMCSWLYTGDTKDNPFWNFVRDLLHDPTPAQIKCHAPKPILLDTGYITIPYPWQPSILPLQLLRVGQLVIIGVPAEFTLVCVCVCVCGWVCVCVWVWVGV